MHCGPWAPCQRRPKETQWGQLLFRPPPTGETREYKHTQSQPLEVPAGGCPQQSATIGTKLPSLMFPPLPVALCRPSTPPPPPSLCADPVHKTLLSQPPLSPKITSSFFLQEWDSSLLPLDTALDTSPKWQVSPPKPTIPFKHSYPTLRILLGKITFIKCSGKDQRVQAK